MPVSFDRVAPYYDWLAHAVLGKGWRQSQTAFLPMLSRSSTILVVGGGTGWWLPILRAANPTATILFVDASEAMLVRARAQISDPLTTFFRGTHEEIPPGVYEAIVLFYFLDLFRNENVPSVLDRLKQHTTNSTLWLITDFVGDRPWQRVLISLMYAFFRATTGLRTSHLPDWGSALRQAGLAELRHQCFGREFMRTSAWVSQPKGGQQG